MTEYTGWIITNYGQPVFPTLQTTRRDCISGFALRRALTQGEWEAMRRKGSHKCVKVTLTLPEQDKRSKALDDLAEMDADRIAENIPNSGGLDTQGGDDRGWENETPDESSITTMSERNEDSRRLARAMGWTVDVIDNGFGCRDYWTSPDGEVTRSQPPNPFTDANDHYAVLEWMRNSEEPSQFKQWMALSILPPASSFK